MERPGGFRLRSAALLAALAVLGGVSQSAQMQPARTERLGHMAIPSQTIGTGEYHFGSGGTRPRNQRQRRRDYRRSGQYPD